MGAHRALCGHDPEAGAGIDRRALLARAALASSALAIPRVAHRPFLVLLTPGAWRERLTIDVPGDNMASIGAAAFVRCWMDAHIRRDGWTSMGFTGPDGTRRQLTPQEARPVEHASRGPGAGPAAATRRIVDARAAHALTDATAFREWRSRA